MPLMKRFSAIFLLMLALPAGLYAQQSGKGSAATDYISVYQKYMSPVKHTHCRMYPSCSTFGKLVFSVHSFPVAMALTADRLTRCGHDTWLYPSAGVGGHFLPVDYPAGVAVPQGLVAVHNARVAAETIQVRDSLDLDIQFVGRLINQANYYGALTEIERLLFYSPDRFASSVALQVSRLKCYEGLKDYARGLSCYDVLPQTVKSDYRLCFEAAHLSDLSGDSGVAIARYLQCADLYPQSTAGLQCAVPSSPYGELAVLYMKAGQYDEAQEAIRRRTELEADYLYGQASLDVIGVTRDAGRKNKVLAQVIGIIPGAGYLYVGSPANAVTAFIINGLLAYATYTSFHSGNIGVGVITGALALSFYAGNIYGSGLAAERYNSRILNDGVDKLRKFNPYIN
jgi:putative component of membrane protein insertase Oxa1/YidC/SpoIIIJ protein YidD/tetratricopeptide (TPR) repeat protein